METLGAIRTVEHSPLISCDNSSSWLYLQFSQGPLSEKQPYTRREPPSLVIVAIHYKHFLVLRPLTNVLRYWPNSSYFDSVHSTLPHCRIVQSLWVFAHWKRSCRFPWCNNAFHTSIRPWILFLLGVFHYAYVYLTVSRPIHFYRNFRCRLSSIPFSQQFYAFMVTSGCCSRPGRFLLANVSVCSKRGTVKFTVDLLHYVSCTLVFRIEYQYFQYWATFTNDFSTCTIIFLNN